MILASPPTNPRRRGLLHLLLQSIGDGSSGHGEKSRGAGGWDALVLGAKKTRRMRSAGAIFLPAQRVRPLVPLMAFRV